MKHRFKVLMLVSLLISGACDETEKDPQQSDLASTQEAISDPTAAAGQNENSLLNTPHLTEDEFASWLPETLLGYPKTSSNINMLPGVGSASATYSIHNTRIRIMVIDGAGEKGGNGIAPYRMSSTQNYDQVGDWGYTKSKILGGLKVKESYLKDVRYNLSLFYENRFAVDIKTHEIQPEFLEQIIEELQLEKLKEFMDK